MTTPMSALGAGVSVDYSTPANPVLKIPYSAIASALSWTTPPTSGGVQDLDPWLASIFQSLADWNTAQTTVAHDVVVNQPFPGVQNRNNINSRPTFTYNATVFSKTPVASKPDADDLQG